MVRCPWSSLFALSAYDRAIGNQQTSLAGGTGDTARFHRDLMKAGMVERAVAFAKMRMGSGLWIDCAEKPLPSFFGF